MPCPQQPVAGAVCGDLQNMSLVNCDEAGAWAAETSHRTEVPRHSQTQSTKVYRTTRERCRLRQDGGGVMIADMTYPVRRCRRSVAMLWQRPILPLWRTGLRMPSAGRSTQTCRNPHCQAPMRSERYWHCAVLLELRLRLPCRPAYAERWRANGRRQYSSRPVSATCDRHMRTRE